MLVKYLIVSDAFQLYTILKDNTETLPQKNPKLPFQILGSHPKLRNPEKRREKLLCLISSKPKTISKYSLGSFSRTEIHYTFHPS